MVDPEIPQRNIRSSCERFSPDCHASLRSWFLRTSPLSPRNHVFLHGLTEGTPDSLPAIVFWVGKKWAENEKEKKTSQVFGSQVSGLLQRSDSTCLDEVVLLISLPMLGWIDHAYDHLLPKSSHQILRPQRCWEICVVKHTLLMATPEIRIN